MITELGKGEALVSFLEGNGTPSMVERCMIRPPCARLGPITAEERKKVMARSPVKGKYDHGVDSESAYENPAEAGEIRHAAGHGTPAGQGGSSGSIRVGGFGGVLGGVGSVLGSIFGIGRSRGTRLSTGQVIAREVTRSVTGPWRGKVAADIGKSLGRKDGELGGPCDRARNDGRNIAALSVPGALEVGVGSHLGMPG